MESNRYKKGVTYHKSPHFYTYVTPNLLLIYTYYTLRCMKGVKQEGPPKSESTEIAAGKNETSRSTR